MSNILGTSYEFNIEFTLNYPQNSRFRRLILPSKLKLYDELLEYLRIHFNFIVRYDYFVEYCKSGEPHVHGVFYCRSPQPYSIEGALSEIVQVWTSQLPRRSQLVLHKYHYCDKYRCYRTPSIFLRYLDITDIERAMKWAAYIKKNNL